MEMTLVQWLAMIGAVSMPIFNIPLIVRIWTRKSSLKAPAQMKLACSDGCRSSQRYSLT
jgi:hypothetical protein